MVCAEMNRGRDEDGLKSRLDRTADRNADPTPEICCVLRNSDGGTGVLPFPVRDEAPDFCKTRLVIASKIG